MNQERRPDETDIELACDGDLTTNWQAVSKNDKTPRERVTIEEAQAAYQRVLDG